MAVIVKGITSSGSSGLNIEYGLTPPTDTSKLWIPLEKKPDYVEINGEFMAYGKDSVELASYSLSNHTYCLGTYSMGCWCDGYFWMFGGQHEELSDNYYFPVHKYDPVTNTKTFVKNLSSAKSTSVSMCYCSACVPVGKKIYIFNPRLADVDNNSTGAWAGYIIYDTETSTYTKHYNTKVYQGDCSHVRHGDYIYLTRSYDRQGNVRISVKDNSVSSYTSMSTAQYNFMASANGKLYQFIQNGSSYNIAVYCCNPDEGFNWTSLGTINAYFDYNDILGDTGYTYGKYIYFPLYTGTSTGDVRIGGTSLGSYRNVMFRYNTEDNTIENLGSFLPTGYTNDSWYFMKDARITFIGGNVKDEGTQSTFYPVTKRISYFNFETYLKENHLKIFTDMFGKQTALVNDKNYKLYATVREAYLGNSYSYAEVTNACIYDEDVGEWKTIDGVSVTQDMLTAMSELGVL